jgi:hypothetical protein
MWCALHGEAAASFMSTVREEHVLLTEAEVERSYRQILKKNNQDTDSIDRAEALLEELRPESPLRHRLLSEIEELRKLAKS